MKQVVKILAVIFLVAAFWGCGDDSKDPAQKKEVSNPYGTQLKVYDRAKDLKKDMDARDAARQSQEKMLQQLDEQEY